MSEFQMPAIHVGDRVEFRSDPSSAPVAGLIVRPKSRGADVVIFTGRRVTPEYRFDCLYDGDPRIETQAHTLFVQQKGERGIFRLAASELRHRELEEKLQALETMLGQMGSELDKLKRKRD